MLLEPVFARACVAVVLASVAFALELLSIVLFAQRVWGWSATLARLAVGRDR